MRDRGSNSVVFWVAAVVIALPVLGVLFGSWFTVDQGERTVVLRNGAFVRVVEPGLHWKMPFIEDAKSFSVRTERSTYDKVESYSKDIQLAKFKLTINHRLDPGRVREVYERYGREYVDRILTPAVQGESKVVFGRFNARTSIEERGRLAVEMETALRVAVKDTGIIIEQVQIEDIGFSQEFENSIEQRMKAEVEVQKLIQNHEREKVQADIKRTQAAGRADAIRSVAQAEADAIRLKGAAEAAAITARSEALKQNANLIDLVKAERWDGRLPVTMLPASTVPFVNIK